jgi:hypothetical protein
LRCRVYAEEHLVLLAFPGVFLFLAPEPLGFPDDVFLADIADADEPQVTFRAHDVARGIMEIAQASSDQGFQDGYARFRNHENTPL